MRNKIWKIIILIVMLLLCNSSAFTQGLNGWFNISNDITKTYEDKELTSESETLNRNIYLNFEKPITSMLSYNLSFRTNFQDSDSDQEKSYRRMVEPAVDLYLRNPAYDLSGGFKRQEQWTTAHMNDASRVTTDFYYSRFFILPEDLPSLSLQADRQSSYDYASERSVDSTDTLYSVNSSYTLPSRDLKLEYTVNFTHSVNETPLSLSHTKENDNFNGSYELGYSGEFRRAKTNYHVGYKGNYSRNKNVQFVTQSTSVLVERIRLGGLYIEDTTPSDGALNTLNGLIDGNYSSPVTAVPNNINIGSTGTTYHNIGVWVSTGESIERLYIYVNQDVMSDSNLISAANWRLYSSSSNVPSTTWSDISSVIGNVSVHSDTINNKYWYEIRFTTPQNSSFFKVVNLATVSIAGLDVRVTEIEAYGSEIPDDDVITSVFTSYMQGLSMSANIKPLNKLRFILNYSLDRSDQNPVSLTNSMSGFFSNVFSDSVSDEKDNLTSNITRSYGATSQWFTREYLTTSLQWHRNETFDNTGDTDISSNTYNLSFSYEPLQTLDANLSLIRNETFKFGDKDSASNSMIVSVGSKLYRGVNMITDFSFTKSKSFINDTDSSSRQINGTIDAALTRRLSGTINYNFSWSTSDGASSSSKEGSTVLTYRPGKFINISGNASILDSSGEIKTTEALLVDWLPLKAIRLNMNYQYIYDEQADSTTHSVGNYVIWYITKFADARVTYNYSHESQDVITENHTFNTQLSCRF